MRQLIITLLAAVLITLSAPAFAQGTTASATMRDAVTMRQQHEATGAKADAYLAKGFRLTAFNHYRSLETDLSQELEVLHALYTAAPKPMARTWLNRQIAKVEAHLAEVSEGAQLILCARDSS